MTRETAIKLVERVRKVKGARAKRVKYKRNWEVYLHVPGVIFAWIFTEFGARQMFDLLDADP